MKNKIILFFAIICVVFSACRKASSGVDTTEDFNALKQTVLNDFVDNVALPQYQNLSQAANTLNADVTALLIGKEPVKRSC